MDDLGAFVVDHFPVTGPGRGVAVALMMIGIGLFSVVTANVAAFFVEEGDSGAENLSARLDRIEQLLVDQRDGERTGSHAIPPE